MKKIRKIFSNNFIILLLLVITLLSSFIGILSYNPKKAFAEENSLNENKEEEPKKAEDTITVKGVTYNVADEYFGIAKGYNDVIQNLDGKICMSVVVKYDPTINESIDLRKPDEYKLYTKKYCGENGCKKTYYHSVFFESAVLKLQIYKYNVTETSSLYGTHTLTYYNSGNWEINYVPEKGFESFSVAVKSSGNFGNSLNYYGNPFQIINGYPCLEYYFEPEDDTSNYFVKFSYDYKFADSTGSNVGWQHKHYWENHIRTYDMDKNVDYCLADETRSLKGIYVNNIKPCYCSETLLEDLIKDYGEYIGNYLSTIEESFCTENVTVGYLVPIDISNDVIVPDEYKEKEIPFAYLQTVNITCRVTDSRILKSDFIAAMREAGYVSEDYGSEFLTCLNSICSMGEYIDQKVKTNVVTERNYYEVEYDSTYLIHLKSSSGTAKNTILGLSNFYDYYHNFTYGSDSGYDILEQKFVDYMFSCIMKNYGLLNFKFKDYINSTSGNTRYKTLTAYTLYGYWGFSLIPGGEMLDGLLSKFVDAKKNSNGIAITYTSECRLNGTSLSALRANFGYSWLGGVIADTVSKFSGNTNNATFYSYYVAEISNDYVYVISENDSLELTDTSSLTDKGVKDVANKIGNVFKKVGKTVKNLFNQPKKLLFILLVVFIVIILLWFVIKLFKKE